MQLLNNKRFKVFKYSLASVLVFMSFWTLLAAWYQGLAPGVESFGKKVLLIELNNGLRISNLFLGLIGLITSVVIFANEKNKKAVLYSIIFGLVLLITISLTSMFAIANTTYYLAV